MSTRRIQALRALAERGSTEGEREAARNALLKHEGSVRNAHRSAPSSWDWRQDWTDRAQRERRERAQAANTWEQHKARYFAAANAWQQCRHPEEPAEEKPDYSHLEQAKDDYDPTNIGGALIEVSTNAEMHTRFKSSEPFKFIFRRAVWEASQVGGYVHEHSRSRFWLRIRKSSMRRVVDL